MERLSDGLQEREGPGETRQVNEGWLLTFPHKIEILSLDPAVFVVVAVVFKELRNTRFQRLSNIRLRAETASDFTAYRLQSRGDSVERRGRKSELLFSLNSSNPPL